MSACGGRPGLLLGIISFLAVAGCGSDPADDSSVGQGAPVQTGAPGSGGPGNGNGIAIPNPGTGGGSGSGTSCKPTFTGRVRDFKASHPDFEGVDQPHEKGIVLDELKLPERKPVFSGNPMLKTVHTKADFDQWYNDTPGINEAFEHTITFEVAPDGSAVYDDPDFFPIDGRGFGNEGLPHNFGFTFELHMTFRYEGGEHFNFRGDDDLYVFVNDKLAVDLGGVHAALDGPLDLDKEAARLGITPGNEYPLDFFQAERHTWASNFRIESTLKFTNCKPIIIP